MKTPTPAPGICFERLTVVKRLYPKIMPSGKKQQRWHVVCSCGNHRAVAHSSLKSGLTRSCGCMQKKSSLKNLEKTPSYNGAPSHNRLDLTGQKFSRLTCTGFSHTEGNATYWNFTCDCGNEITRKGAMVKFGHIRSCGCLNIDKARERMPAIQQAFANTKHEKNVKSVLGKRFGMITVTSAIKGKYNAIAEYVCDCGNKSKGAITDIKHGRIKSCGCVTGISHLEKDIFEFVLSLDPTAKHDVSIGDSKLRYDIVCHEKMIAIEVNGYYWHSAHLKDRRYHLDKRIYAEKHGFRMISIWQDQWEHKKERVKLLIAEALGKISRKMIGARETTAQIISAKTANRFHKEHHIQDGVAMGPVHVGLFHDNKLVAAASFKNRKGKFVELSRYTVKTGFSIVGGMMKTIKIARAAYKKHNIITFADRDHFNGTLYKRAGFQKTNTTLQLTYIKNGQRIRREKLMKHKLPELGIEVLPDDTEWSALVRHKIFPCYNSGIDRYELT